MALKSKRDKVVPGAGLEPARPNGHMALNHACLPIPAPGYKFMEGAPYRLVIKNLKIFRKEHYAKAF